MLSLAMVRLLSLALPLAAGALSACGVDSSLTCGARCDPDASARFDNQVPGEGPVDSSVNGSDAPLAAADGSGGPSADDGSPVSDDALADGWSGDSASASDVAANCSACGAVLCCTPQQCIAGTCCNGNGQSCSGGCCSNTCSTAGTCVDTCLTTGSCLGQSNCCRGKSYCDATGHCTVCLAPGAPATSAIQCCNGKLSGATCALDT